MLRFFGDFLRNGKNWGQCKSELVKEFFPLFVLEMLIRDLIVFNFHNEGQPLREYVDQVFAASKILEYKAGEQQLVDRIVMNLNPSILAHATFLERPRSRRQLTNAIGLIEEKLSVLNERQKTQPVTTNLSGSNPRGREPSRNARTGSSSLKF